MKYKHISKNDRLELSILLNKSYSIREIARVLEKNPSSISREIKRNSNAEGIYNPKKANHKAYVKRKYSKFQGMKIACNTKLQKLITFKLKQFWTPEQIANRLKRDNDGEAVISTKSIYKYLHSSHGQKYCKHLESKRYQPRKYKKKKKGIMFKIPNRISIHLRPEIVSKRLRFGDYEGDTLGKIKTDINVIAGTIERKSRYVLLKKVNRMKYAMDGFKQMLKPYHSTIQSLTLDNGVENFKYQMLNISTYFCDPYSSWQKGSIENTFKRLRRFIPKGSSIKNLTQDQIDDIVEIMNNTPRKCLNWRTPREVFEEELNLNQSSVALEGKI